MTEPTRAEVLAFMARTGLGPADAARHFLPSASRERQKKLGNRIRTWKRRAEKGRPSQAKPKPDQPEGPPVEVVTTPPPDQEVAQMETVERLEWLVAYVAAGVKHAHSRGDVHAVSSAAKTLVSAGQALDKAREQRGKLVGLERTAEGLAKSMNVTAEIRRRLQASRKHKKAKNL